METNKILDAIVCEATWGVDNYKDEVNFSIKKLDRHTVHVGYDNWLDENVDACKKIIEHYLSENNMKLANKHWDDFEIE